MELLVLVQFASGEADFERCLEEGRLTNSNAVFVTELSRICQ